VLGLGFEAAGSLRRVAMGLELGYVEPHLGIGVEANLVRVHP
jgi:hypothetical protein